MDSGGWTFRFVQKCVNCPRFPRPAGVWFAVVALLVSISGFAFASAPIEIAWPGEPGVLHTGQMGQVRWGRLGPEVEEAELLLVVNNENGFTLRLTEEFEPDLDSYIWVVPNLPARAARICIRVGIEGREVQMARSGEFRIEPELNEPPPPIRFKNGEWWAGAVCADFSPQPGPGPSLQYSERDTGEREAVLPERRPTIAIGVSTTAASPQLVQGRGSRGDLQPSSGQSAQFAQLRE
jgi:hypothetical protein